MDRVTLESVVEAREEPVTTAVDDEIVVLNPATGMYQGLRGIGPDIWTHIQEPVSVERLVSRIRAESDVERARAVAEITAFLQSLLDEQLIRVDDRSGE